MTDRPAHALRAVIRGRVQGVGCRDYCRTRARALGLSGSVRNLPDGRSVEVIAEGPPEEIQCQPAVLEAYLGEQGTT